MRDVARLIDAMPLLQPCLTRRQCELSPPELIGTDKGVLSQWWTTHGAGLVTQLSDFSADVLAGMSVATRLYKCVLHVLKSAWPPQRLASTNLSLACGPTLFAQVLRQASQTRCA